MKREALLAAVIGCGGTTTTMDGGADATVTDALNDVRDAGACSLDVGPVGAPCTVGSQCCSGACGPDQDSGSPKSVCLYACVTQKLGGNCNDGKPCCENGTCHPEQSTPPYSGHCTWP